MRSIPTAFVLLLAAVSPGAAQPLPFDADHWEIRAAEHRVVPFAGKTALYLKDGLALLKGEPFTDGVVTFHVAFPAGRNFTGVVWRWQDDANHEHFYFRPHRSGEPDANQYTPVFHGVSGWQLYTGPGYSAPTRYPFERWIPVRLVVSGGQAEVYVGDQDAPALVIPELKRAVASGRFGLLGGALAPTYFADVTVARQALPLRGEAAPSAPAPPGTLRVWQVSDAFAEAELGPRLTLDGVDGPGRTWTPLRAEATGVVNLARVQGLDGDRNTGFARATVTSDRAQVKRPRFGFSDRVRVYCDGRLLYDGDDGYQSRDYRFLGTVGAFDALYLPLGAGPNELRTAVTERFGGWGVLAFFEDPTGLHLPD